MIRRQLILCLAVLIAGCGESEEIRVERVPKPAATAVKTIATLIPQPDATWFLKISGPADAVSANDSDFHQFSQSITFGAKDQPISFVAPPTWTSENAGADRYAVWRTANGMEVSVTRLGPEANNVLDNVNRWRRQIQLPPIAETELADCTKSITIGNQPATQVTLANNGPTPFLLKQAPVQPPSTGRDQPRDAQQQLKYETPTGWQAKPSNAIRVASFRAGDGDQAADVSVIPLPNPAGTIAQNVNRWRGELGLSTDESDSQIQASAKELVVMGKPRQYFDLLGPAKTDRQRTLAVMVPCDDLTWFIKMRGPADTVARQQAAFESFVRSLQIPGGGN